MKISNPRTSVGNYPLVNINSLNTLLQGPTEDLSSNGYVPLNTNQKIDSKFIDVQSGIKINKYTFSTTTMTFSESFTDTYTNELFGVFTKTVPGFVIAMSDSTNKSLITEFEYLSNGNTNVLITLLSQQDGDNVTPQVEQSFYAFSLLNADGSTFTIPSAETI